MRTLFNNDKEIFCLDTNVFIEAWRKYYPPCRVKNYWEILDNLAKQNIIFSPIEVKKELEKKDDDIKKWIKRRGYFFQEPDERVTLKVAEILEQFPDLVNNVKNRSVADPWVIAHAEVEGATVVTKEGDGSGKKNKIKIPDVCRSRGVKCIDDFSFLDEMGISFEAKI